MCTKKYGNQSKTKKGGRRSVRGSIQQGKNPTPFLNRCIREEESKDGTDKGLLLPLGEGERGAN